MVYLVLSTKTRGCTLSVRKTGKPSKMHTRNLVPNGSLCVDGDYDTHCYNVYNPDGGSLPRNEEDEEEREKLYEKKHMSIPR